MRKIVRIGDKKFRIKEKNYIGRGKVGEVSARIYHQDKLILLKKKIPKKTDALFHEISHSILRQLSNKKYKGFFTPNSKLFKLSYNEEVVEKLAILLRKTFKLK